MEVSSRIERRLAFKNRMIWIVGILWAIILGIAFYFLFMLGGPAITYLTLISFTFAIGLLSGICLKTPKLIVRNSFVFPFGLVITAIFNQVSPKWVIGDTGALVGFYLGNFVLLALLCYLILFIASGIALLVVGFELMPEDPLTVDSYRIKTKLEDPPNLLRKALAYLGVKPTKLSRSKETTSMGFRKDSNEYAVFFSPSDQGTTEADFVVFRVKNDTLIKADENEKDIFFAALNGIMKVYSKTTEWSTENTPRHDKTSRNTVLDYASPMKLELVLPSQELIKQRTFSWLKENKKVIIIGIFTFIAGVAMQIIATLIAMQLIDIAQFLKSLFGG